MSAFVVSNIAADLKMQTNDQRFIFGNNALPEPLASFKIDNIFTPAVGTPSVTNFETRNNTLSGFRWVHTTNSSDTFGSLKLQSFVNAQPTGTDILLFNADGSVVINNLNVPSLDVNSPFHINYTAPLTALYLKGPSSTVAGFVYSNSLLETLLFSATDLRISSTSGQIHFGLDSGTNDFITFNNQGFKSIVNFIANNPDTSGFIPEKGLVLETLGTQRGAVTFDHVDNQMKIYTSGNDPILFGVNSINAMQILTSGNIDLLGHRITNAADPVNLQDYATKAYADSVAGQLSNPYSLVDNLTFNWSSTSVINPSNYEFKHQLTDSQIDKKYRYRVLTNDSFNGREWSIDYTLIGNSDLNGIFEIKYGSSPLPTIIPLKIEVFPFVPVTYITLNGQLNLNGNRIVATSNTAPTSLNPSSTILDLFNNTNAGYRFKHQITTSDLIGNMKLLYVNTLGNEFEFLTASFSAFSVPQVTINGDFIVSGNSTLQYTTFNGAALFNDSCFVQTPTVSGHAANKLYVDDSLNNFAISTPITLTGAVTGINSINNPIFTTFASTIPVSGASQIFNFSLNSNVVYRLNNTLAATTGTPSTIALSLNNATNGGYRLLHTSTSTDPAGLGTLKLQALNSSGVTADIFTASVNPGNGITDTLFNSTATFNNAVTIQNNQSLIVTGNSGVADYLVMNNTNLSSKTQLRINVTGLPVATFGYDAAASQVYIDSPFGAGSPFVIKFGGTTRFIMNNSTGNIGIGGNTSPNAPLQFGSSTANRKIVLYETANNDHQYYGFGINNGLLRYQIDSIFASHAWYAATSNTTSNELMRLNGNGQLTFSKSDSLSSIIFNNTNPASFANEIMFLNNGNFAGAFGFNNASNEAYVWAYGTAALKFGTAATERFRITPTGDAVFQNTIYGRLVSGTMSMQNNAVGTTITTANTFVKVAGTTITSNLNGLSSPISNRLTVSSTISHTALINVSFTADHNGGGGEETTFALYKNGLQLANTLISSQSMNDLLALSINTTVSMSNNDYIELWCTSPNNGRIITVKRLLFTYTTT
jgi:hypothetical protein